MQDALAGEEGCQAWKGKNVMLGTDTAKVVSCHVMIEHVTGSISKNIFFRILPVDQDGLELVTRTKQ